MIKWRNLGRLTLTLALISTHSPQLSRETLAELLTRVRGHVVARLEWSLDVRLAEVKVAPSTLALALVLALEHLISEARARVDHGRTERQREENDDAHAHVLKVGVDRGDGVPKGTRRRGSVVVVVR